MVQHLVFEEASSVMKMLSGIELNAKQIERICHKYGQRIEEEDLAVSEQQVYTKEQSEAVHYASVDGSIYLILSYTLYKFNIMLITLHSLNCLRLLTESYLCTFTTNYYRIKFYS